MSLIPHLWEQRRFPAVERSVTVNWHNLCMEKSAIILPQWVISHTIHNAETFTFDASELLWILQKKMMHCVKAALVKIMFFSGNRMCFSLWASTQLCFNHFVKKKKNTGPYKGTTNRKQRGIYFTPDSVWIPSAHNQTKLIYPVFSNMQEGAILLLYGRLKRMLTHI